MKKKTFNCKIVREIASLALAMTIIFLLWPANAKAEEAATIRLQIKTNDASLYDQNIDVAACEDSPTASTTSINAKCAIEQSGLTSDWSWWGEDAFLNSLGAYVNNAEGNGIYWAWFSNLVYGEVALNKHILANGEKLLLTYNVNPLKISVDNNSPYVNATSTITVEQFGLDENWSPAWTPATDSKIVIGDEEQANASGVYEYVPQVAGEKIIYAKKTGYVDSDSITITAQELATSTVRLQIKTSDASLYDGEITVSACADSPAGGTLTVNAKCAIEQSGLTSDWSWWGADAFLNSLGAYVNNAEGNGIYWAWFSNLVYGEVALNKHELANGEKLLLAYNTNPLKISVDNTTPDVNATSTITVEQFGLDASWSPVWTAAASSTLMIGETEVENDSGSYEYTSAVAGEKIIYAKKDGYVDSDSITITAQAVVNEEDENTGGNNNQPSGSVIIQSSGGGGNSPLPAATVKVDLGKAVDYLINKQNADGSFGSALVTDWAALALASANPNGAAGQKVKSYLLADSNPLVGLNPVSDYARRAMALMSLGVSPYDGVKTNYVKKITDLFDGRQFGDASLYNDDIFALLVLNKAGYGADEEIIKTTVEFIIAKQQADGSWNGSDLTAAAVQALGPVSALNGVSAALAKARNFLASAQGADGGFGNSFTTPWVMQAIAALGESSDAWQKNNKTPESFLAASQGADGGLEKDNQAPSNRIWSTAYAIPAAQGKPWTAVMNSFSKIAEAEPAVNANAAADNLAATSTLEILDLATSTTEKLIKATSTPIELTEEIKNKETENILEKKAETANAAAAEKKAEAPKVLAVKIVSPKIASATKNEALKKPAPKTLGVPEAPSAKTKPAENKLAISQSEPKVDQPMAAANILVSAGRLIYRSLRYVLSLLGF